MPAILGALPAALLSARGGQSANAFYRELQSLGMGARRSEVLALHKLAVGIVTRSPDEPFRDITKIPAGHEMQPWPTKKATGIMQNVTLVYRDRITGTILNTYWRNTSENGIKRETAMATAINAYSDHAESYNQDLIGAVHTSSYNMVPFS